MSFRVGDPVFSQFGRPAVIKERNEESKDLVADQNQPQVYQTFRHGYIKGLDTEQRKAFTDLLDQVEKIEKPEEKIKFLQDKVLELENESTPNSQRVLSYYKAELSHAMHSFNYDPRYYTIPGIRAVD